MGLNLGRAKWRLGDDGFTAYRSFSSSDCMSSGSKRPVMEHSKAWLKVLCCSGYEYVDMKLVASLLLQTFSCPMTVSGLEGLSCHINFALLAWTSLIYVDSFQGLYNTINT